MSVAPARRVVLTCTNCAQTFSRRLCDVKPGADPFCGNACALVAKRRIASEKAAKFGRTTRIAPKIAPAEWTWPIDAGSNIVACARCGLERPRGVRCSCERGPISHDDRLEAV